MYLYVQISNAVISYDCQQTTKNKLTKMLSYGKDSAMYGNVRYFRSLLLLRYPRRTAIFTIVVVLFLIKKNLKK